VTIAPLIDAPDLTRSKPQRLDLLFAERAAKAPGKVALIHQGTTVRYGALDQRANRLAHHLIALGIGPGALVGVCMRRSPEMIVAILGVLKAGGAYVPLDPAYPTGRLDFMLADSAVSVLLTDSGVHERLNYRGRVLSPTLDAAAIAARPSHAPPIPYDSNDLAYVIYTSGSTGQPKGVMLGHSAIGLIEWARRTFTSAELSRVAATTSICFDPSVFEIFAPLCTGGAVVIKENALDPFSPEERPTMLNCVPSVLAELCRSDGVPESVRTINIGGEPLKATLVREVYRRTKVSAVYNHYGPTEATTCTTVALAPRDLEQDPPIGRPIAGAKVYVLDDQGRQVQSGAIGELYIGGQVLARGYLNRPELTAARFRDDLLGPDAGRLYRTGDLVRWSPAGDLVFVGRVDQQVKLKGFRVELGEIENSLLRLPAVRDAAVIVKPDKTGSPQLVAYVESGAALTLREVRAELKLWLPEHMLPAQLVILDAFPLTLTGKIDRNALPDPQERRAGASGKAGRLSRVEEAIAEAFKDVLQLDQFDVEESFFELGGDSLLGVRAALRLEEILGHSIPPALIHQAATPRSLAEALERCPIHQPQHLSVLQAGGAGTPLFCLSDLFGRPFSYLSLARRLAPDRPVYGLSPGPLEEAFAAQQSIAALTEAYVAELRRVQPGGPYLLCGYSAGGLLAFDLARALEAQGEAVRLILLDCPISRGCPPLGALMRWAYRQARACLAPRNFRNRAGRLYAMGRKLLHSLTPMRLKRPPEWVPSNKEAFASGLMRAYANYSYGKFHAPALLVKCMERDPIDDLFDHDAMLGWSGILRGPVATVQIASNHHAFMREPGVHEVAGHLTRFIDGR
jgi:amino acid adenylation domain-containing protein